MLWVWMRPYKGLTGDAELYAVQALARIQPGLAHDLYLRYVSQDSYTIFSPFYSWCIEGWGLQNAALALTIICSVGFYAASWALARQLSDSAMAFLAVALLIVTVGSYGAYSVFHYSEDWLTARSPAEVLIVTALGCHFRGWKALGLILALGALIIHPLMALPGVLLLVCLWLPLRVSVIASGVGVLIVLGMAAISSKYRMPQHVLAIMDAEWLEVVRERSKFLFPELWSFNDWELTVRPFISLSVTVMALRDIRVRKLCLAAMLVGASGIAVALVASAVGPVAVLVQGQAWRWVWITAFTSVLLLAPTALKVWHDGSCGPLCAILLVAGWVFPDNGATALCALALILWLIRGHFPQSAATYLRWAAGLFGVGIAAWVLTKSWHAAVPGNGGAGVEPSTIMKVRNILGLEVPALVLVWLLWLWIRTRRSAWVVTVISAVLITGIGFSLPGYVSQRATITPAETAEFSDWRQAIPVDGNVFVMPSHNSASFAWFALERPSYLSVDQSAGVVFSRETAMEVRRRSEVLLPVLDPDWRLMTAPKSMSRPLTKDRLETICNDPQLGFVVSRESVGFDPMRHTQSGRWKDWNLYDCRHVRALAPSA